MAEPKRLTPDILVIGAGSGGLSVASGAVQMGASVVLLEGHRMGGDCLNFGCVPSKALIASAKAAHGQAHSAPFGVANVTPQVDYAAAMEHVAHRWHGNGRRLRGSTMCTEHATPRRRVDNR